MLEMKGVVHAIIETQTCFYTKVYFNFRRHQDAERRIVYVPDGIRMLWKTDTHIDAKNFDDGKAAEKLRGNHSLKWYCDRLDVAAGMWTKL